MTCSVSGGGGGGGGGGRGVPTYSCITENSCNNSHYFVECDSMEKLKN